MKDELRFDAAIDHRTPDFAGKLAEACPNGIDIYFENVGGAIWQAVLPLLNGFARVPVCGLIRAIQRNRGSRWARPARGDHARGADQEPDPARLYQL